VQAGAYVLAVGFAIPNNEIIVGQRLSRRQIVQASLVWRYVHATQGRCSTMEALRGRAPRLPSIHPSRPQFALLPR